MSTYIELKKSSNCPIGRQSDFLAKQKQAKRLQERRKSNPYNIILNDIELKINPGVYKTGKDTELMINVLKSVKFNSFLEIGCGTGAISIYCAQKAKYGVAVDINNLAVKNTKANCKLNRINNLIVKKSNVFENVSGKYDIIICNPPYNTNRVNDDIDRMFWDPNNEMKIAFFKEVGKYLKDSGKVYFGWADFSDLDFNLPINESLNNGLQFVKQFSRLSDCKSYRFIVIEFQKATQAMKHSVQRSH